MTGTAEERQAAVREAVQADLLGILRIEKESFPQPWPFSAFERFLGESGFLVAEPPRSGGASPGPVLGYVVADCVPNHGRPLGHIKDLAVMPDERGQGVGSLLLDHVLAALTEQGAASVKLEVRESNDAAIGLYQSRGFEYLRTVPRYYADGEDAYVLVRELD